MARIELQSSADLDHLVEASRAVGPSAFVDAVFDTVKQNVTVNHDGPNTEPFDAKMNNKVQAAASEVEALTLELATRRQVRRLDAFQHVDPEIKIGETDPKDLKINFSSQNIEMDPRDLKITSTMDKLDRARGVADLS